MWGDFYLLSLALGEGILWLADGVAAGALLAWHLAKSGEFWNWGG